MAAGVLTPGPPSESGTLVHGLQRQMQLTESPVGVFLDLFLTTEACFLPQRLWFCGSSFGWSTDASKALQQSLRTTVLVDSTPHLLGTKQSRSTPSFQRPALLQQEESPPVPPEPLFSRLQMTGDPLFKAGPQLTMLPRWFLNHVLANVLVLGEARELTLARMGSRDWHTVNSRVHIIFHMVWCSPKVTFS